MQVNIRRLITKREDKGMQKGFLSNAKQKVGTVSRQMLKNAIQFAIGLLFISAFQALFGMENILVGVALSVGFTMLPDLEWGIRPKAMLGITVGLFVGSGIVAQLALVSPWIALPVNFLFVLLILLLTGEPEQLKPYMSFLLCFVFAQSTPVPWEAFPKRLLGMAVGGLFVAVVAWFKWKKTGNGANGRPIREQIALCKVGRGFILRMSLGIACAMFIGMALGLKKPLWISIVVMSLTQVHFQQTFQRIKYRALGTVLGIGVFVVFFQLLIPKEYAFLGILLLGYISYFLPEYKHKQVINAVSALNASLVLLDTTAAIADRCLCLLGGVAIVIVFWGLHKIARELWKDMSDFRGLWQRTKQDGRTC